MGLDKFRVWAEVNLGRLRDNYRVIRNFLPGSVAVMGVVKADAYGHGAAAIGKCLENEGIDALGVGDSLEALELRETGIECPIYVLGALAGAEIPRIVENDIIPTVHSHSVAKMLDAESARQGKVLQVNVIVDTGMGRLGVKPNEVLDILRTIQDAEHLHLEGLSTHFPSAGLGDQDFSRMQVSEFRRVVEEAGANGIEIPSLHTANTSALFNMPDALFNMTRPGIALYGIDPGGLNLRAHDLQPVLSLKTQIVFIKNVRKGTSIGYNRTWFTRENTKIATLPVGYNDGYPYSLSNKAEVLIGGERRPVIGLVSMDYTMVDLGPHSRAKVGDEVTLVGESGGDTITVEDVAAAAGTIPYEITTGLGKRVKRIYTEMRPGEE